MYNTKCSKNATAFVQCTSLDFENAEGGTGAGGSAADGKQEYVPACRAEADCAGWLHNSYNFEAGCTPGGTA